jgi:hypothetical protein
MDRVGEFLNVVRRQAKTPDAFLGLLHTLIGRKVTHSDGSPVTAGLTWREAAALLKRVRWDKEAVCELGLEPDDLPPRDRQRYWYTAIAQAGVDSDRAAQAADRLAQQLLAAGYVVGPAPGR